MLADFFSILLVQIGSIDNGRHREKEDRCREHHPPDQGKRALENIPLWVAVEEGQQQQHDPQGAGKRDRTEKLSELAGKHLQSKMLEYEQEIPFRLRVIIARVRCRLVQQDHRLPEGQHADAGKDHRHPDDVLPKLSWEKIVCLRLQLCRRTAERTSWTCASK